jgi:HD-GYP domain-containing protein (c-di-GMP phosphodiesterase class II)
VIAVASAFAALTQPRPYRSAAYDARGATDVLVAETITGHADANTVKLLVHALRGRDGDPRAIRFGVSREGHQPEINRYTPVEPPARSLV